MSSKKRFGRAGKPKKIVSMNMKLRLRFKIRVIMREMPDLAVSELQFKN